MLFRSRQLWHRLLERRRLARLIDPEAIGRLAGEVADLARAAGAIGPQEESFQARVKRLKAEMEEISALAGRPEFRRMPLERRRELRQSLLASREQLLAAVQSAPTPTTVLQ